MRRTVFALGVGALALSSVMAARATDGREAQAPAAQAAVPAAAVATPQPAATLPSVPQPSAGQRKPAMLIAQDAQAAPLPNNPPVIVPNPAAVSPAPPPVAPPQQGYVVSPQNVYMQDQQAVARINAQIEALMSPPSGGFAVQYYAKPAPAPVQQAALPPGGAAMPQPGAVRRDRNGLAEKYVIARPGDMVYATLDRAFNSDDPQQPIFATIRDVDSAGVQGPLDGVRMIGNIVYSSSQGAIQFNMGYLPDGRPLQVKAIAVSEDTARSGIAKNVDTHDLERYGALLFATLVQGAGQVGQTLLQNNQVATVDPATGFLVSNQRVSAVQAGLAGLLPAGQALTAAAAQGFNRPATISGPAGMGMGLVFLDPVAVPRDLLFPR